MAERGIAGPARVVAACTLASRVLGMVRDVLCAGFFGQSAAWDAYVIAFVVPNLFRRLFGEGALTAAFVPVFVGRLKTRDRASARRLLRSLSSVLSLVLLSLVLFGILLTYLLPTVSSAEKLDLTCRYLRGMLPYLFLVCLTAVLGGALNGAGHFFAPAFSPVLLNGAWIAALLLVAPEVEVLVWSTLVGGALQLLLQVPPLLRRGLNPLPRYDPEEKGVREVAALFAPAVFGLALVQVNELVDNLVAELFVPGDGDVSALYYGNRLMQFPLAVIGTALATAVFPRLSEDAARRDPEGFADSLRRALRSALFVAVPATVGLCVLAVPTIQLLFERGKFLPADTERTKWVLLFFSLGIAAYSANQILARAFYARKDTRTPVRISASMVFANLAFNLLLVGPLREAGLALSTAATGTATSFLLYRRLKCEVPEVRFDLVPILSRFLLLAGAMAAAVLGADAALPAVGHGDTIPEALRLAGLVAVGAAVYFGLERLWRSATSKS